MNHPRNVERHAKVHHKKAGYGSSTKGGAAWIAGRSSYRQDYQRDYGPDLDEWLDATESWEAALAKTS